MNSGEIYWRSQPEQDHPVETSSCGVRLVTGGGSWSVLLTHHIAGSKGLKMERKNDFED